MSLENLHKRCKAVPECKNPDKVASTLFHHDFNDQDAEECQRRGISFSGVLSLVEKYGPQAIAILKDILSHMGGGANMATPPKGEETNKAKK